MVLKFVETVIVDYRVQCAMCGETLHANFAGRNLIHVYPCECFSLDNSIDPEISDEEIATGC